MQLGAPPHAPNCTYVHLGAPRKQHLLQKQNKNAFPMLPLYTWNAKDIAEAVNIQFDQTGVSATASTNMKIQAKGTAGSATLSIGLKGTVEDNVLRLAESAIEAGIDNLDTAISSMSMTYGHSPTETFVSMLDGADRSTGLDIELLEEIASYFRKIREKYAKFEGQLKGVDSRILVAQVPGGMLTNLENQLREQSAIDRLDEVLQEIPDVRKDLGFIPLVTPTSQIVGTQAVLNVLAGERYKNITKETQGVLKGEYGATPAPVNGELQKKVLAGSDPIECRPADLLEPEFEKQKIELLTLAKKERVAIKNEIDDTLTYALFPQAGWKFIKNRGNPSMFEPKPGDEKKEPSVSTSEKRDPEVYTVEVENKSYVVRVTEGLGVTNIEPARMNVPDITGANAKQAGDKGATKVTAPLAGNVFTVNVNIGQVVSEGDTVLVLEAMKMETDIRANGSGKVAEIKVESGDAVKVGDVLLTLN